MEAWKFQRQLRDLESLVEDIEHHIEDQNPEEALMLAENLQSELELLKRRLEKEIDEE